MKKILIFILCIVVMIPCVSATNFPRNDIEQQWEDIIGILNDTVITKSMNDQLHSLIPEIDDIDIKTYSEYGPANECYEWSNLGQYYHKYMNAEKYGVGIHREWAVFDDEIYTGWYYEYIQIDKAAFDYLPDEFNSFIETMRYMEHIEQEISGYWSSDGSYHENKDEFKLPEMDYYEDNGYMILYEDVDGDVAFYQNDVTGNWFTNGGEASYVREVYMVKPDQIKVIYTFGIYSLGAAKSYDDPYLGCNEYYINLNYAAPADDPDAEYSKYELDSIDISLYYGYEADTTPAEGNSTAPQTGFTTIAYAAVAVVSAAAVVAVGKKRR